jgi:Cu+-exporting ATPase
MAKVKDPVCGMSVDTQTAAARSTYAGQAYYFCSTACKQQFDEKPAKFVSPKFGSATSGGGEYEPLPGDKRDLR